MGLGATAVTGERIQPLGEAQWLERAAAHERVVGPLIDAYRERRSSRKTHPIHDFLFKYYRTNRTVLRKWRPSALQILQGERALSFLEDERYVETGRGVALDVAKLDEKARGRLAWAKRLILAARSRPPRFNCFGLHEWAMVYKADCIRHETTPLRVSAEEVAQVVESSCIRCSHYDAFRFFTPEASGLNELYPGRDDRESFEQFGCIHFNMDLYRWSYKGSPWIGSDLIRDSFLLALDARELDMRASPYELRDYGYDPIRIETPEGREAYAARQQDIYRRGQVIADRLLEELSVLLN